MYLIYKLMVSFIVVVNTHPHIQWYCSVYSIQNKWKMYVILGTEIYK